MFRILFALLLLLETWKNRRAPERSRRVAKNLMSVESLENELKELKEKALKDFSAPTTSAALEELRLQYLGQKGSLSTIMRGLSNIDKADRPRVGQIVPMRLSKKLKAL